jgi:CubicO group peptidase (beta-lactamase class C family)
MESEPGGEMIYSTGTSHLLSVILTKSSGMSTLAFANRYLFRPMDIVVGGWDRDPQGYFMGGNNLALRPADMLKIGGWS